MIKGLFYIFLFYYLGEVVSYLIGGFIPGSVIGMLLLFLALTLRLLKPDNVRGAARLIVKNMAIFFVPAAVGLMVYADLFVHSLPLILIAIGVSTVATIISVGATQQYLEKRKGRGNE